MAADRRRCGMLLLGISLVFLTAGLLTPETSGSGTLRQLGLPGCLVRQLTGLRCPTCGMTTGFAFFVRGQWLFALQANPAGFLLAAGMGLSWPVLACSVMGRAVAVTRLLLRWLPVLLLLWSVFTGLQWFVWVLTGTWF